MSGAPLPQGSRPAGLALCVINFNGGAVLAASLQAACALRDCFDDMLLVDNGSSDGSADGVEARYPPFRVERLPANRGAGGARNVGLARARCDRILFIDNDVELTGRCIARLREALDTNPAAALAAATIVYAHRRDTIQYDGAECHFLGSQVLLDEDRPVAEVAPAVRTVGTLSTCAFLADRGRLPKDLTFDETYFYMFEDHDFGIRATLQRAAVLSVTDAYCFHGAGTAGLSIRQLGTYSSRRVYYLIRNRWLVVLKNFSAWTIIVFAPFYLVYEIAQLAIVLRKRWHREWWQAAAWIVSNLRPILAERRRIQASRRIRDGDYLVGGRIPFRADLTAGRLERMALGLLNGLARGYWAIASRLI